MGVAGGAATVVGVGAPTVVGVVAGVVVPVPAVLSANGLGSIFVICRLLRPTIFAVSVRGWPSEPVAVHVNSVPIALVVGFWQWRR